MILQALNDYYERLAGEDDSEIPLRGFSRAKISYALEVDHKGKLKQVVDLREMSGKKMVAKQLVVPEAVKRSGSGFSANFLWDNTGYVLGANMKDKPERTLKAFESFRNKLHAVGDSLSDEGFAAVLAFLDAWEPNRAAELEYWDEMAGQNMVFRLTGEKCFVHERPDVRKAWLKQYSSEASDVLGQCLVTGEKDAPLARLHADIKGVRGAQTKGASLVSFNLDAFTSYGKEQNYNAPVCEAVAFNYTTALNDLLRPNSRQKVQIGNATTVFWTERKTESEGFLGLVFSQSESQGDLNTLRLFLEAARQGKMPDQFKNEGGVRFYVLGLSPNASRLSVRFWHVDTVDGMWRKIGQHFDDLRMVKARDSDPDFPPMWLLLKAMAMREDLDNLSPLLAGALMRAILTGNAYPGSMFATVIGRIRAEQKISYTRAALIKACLVRNARLAGKTTEVTVSLDETSTNTAYRLGRLFAVLEKLQQEAIPGANSTIKDRYYGSASATPRNVFPILLRLAQHHVAKAEYGYASDNRIAQIMNGLEEFPAHLSLENQGMFALGYYHQRTSLWTKKAAAPEATNTSTEQ